jgi:hypothetical protein
LSIEPDAKRAGGAAWRSAATEQQLLIEIGLRTCGSTQIDDSLNRRGWAWPGHPRDAAQALPVSVDARHKAGQDDLAETESSDCNSEH